MNTQYVHSFTNIAYMTSSATLLRLESLIKHVHIKVIEN